MKASDLIPSKYLKQSDVEPPKLVTIAGVEKVKFDDKGTAKEKWTMSFRELDKPLMLNKTNVNRTVRATATDNVDDWTGKKIVLYFDPNVEFGGDIVGGIRIRAPKGQATAPLERASSREDADERMASERDTDGFGDTKIPFIPLHKRSLWA